jgi:hypothetical protein
MADTPVIRLSNPDEYPWNANWLRLMSLQGDYLGGKVDQAEFESRWHALASDDTQEGPQPPSLEELRARQHERDTPAVE